MKAPKVTFGTYIIPFQGQGNDITYVAPPSLSKEMMGDFYFDFGESLLLSSVNQLMKKGKVDEDVTHGSFFGENIKRVIRGLS